MTTDDKHIPDPDSPSSQSVHPAGHASQLGPKKLEAQDSQEEPVKPGGQIQVPEAEQTPAVEQGGEQAADCKSRRVSEPEDRGEGSWEMSGMVSQTITRSFCEPDDIAAHVLEEMESESASKGTDALETLDVGSAIKDASPAKSDSE